uniref:SPOC domain-containing protein n=1 Tax=Lates calcarifer TaxID=8187 RepID=A0A4W6G3Q9_LATCA
MNRRRSRSPVSKDSFPSGHRHLHTQRALSPTGLGYRDYRLQQLALGRLPPPPPPPPPPHIRDLERERDFSVYEARNRPPFIPECAAFLGGQKLSHVWQGVLLLKNSSFPTSLHLLEGDVSVATSLLVDGATGGQVSQLKISQRLRLDQPKLDEVSRRIKVAGSNGYSILLAMPGKEGGTQDTDISTERPLKNLVSYLTQKEAAGIISLPVGGSRDKDHGGVLHAFPPCEFSKQFLDASAKAFAKSEDDYMVMVIIRGAS